MPASIHLFRRERWHSSLDTEAVPGTAGLRLGLAPEIMLRDDARRRRLAQPTEPPPPANRREILRAALDLFTHGELHIGGLGTQSGTDFAHAMRDTAGLPPELTARWCALLDGVVATTRPRGGPDRLTLIYLPGNTFTCLDSAFAAVLGGGTLWLRPSRREPVSAARFVAALLAAGWPAGRIGFYPTAPHLLPTLIAATDEQVLYGGPAMARLAGDHPGVVVHGPGRGLAVVPADADPEEVADRLTELVAADSGRFCRNVCTIACLGDPRPVAESCARRLDSITVDPPDARWPLAATGDDAYSLAAVIDAGLGPDDVRMTRRDPVAHVAARTWLLPTLALVRYRPDHPLLGCELPFPFASVTGVDQTQLSALRAQSLFVHEIPGKD